MVMGLAKRQGQRGEERAMYGEKGLNGWHMALSEHRKYICRSNRTPFIIVLSPVSKEEISCYDFYSKSMFLVSIFVFSLPTKHTDTTPISACHKKDGFLF